MTTSSTPRKFSPLDILNRAGEYEIRITLDGNDLKIEVPDTLEDAKRDKALAVISASSPEIIDYLQGLVSTPLCFTCLDLGKETEAVPEDYEGLMYCADHHPNRKRILVLNGIRMLVGYTRAEHKAHILQEYHSQATQKRFGKR